MTADADRPSTVAMITPIAVDKDSRTYKEAFSMVRFGYRCVVFEGETSSFPRESLPFQLVSLGSSNTDDSTKPLGESSGRAARTRRWIARFLPLTTREKARETYELIHLWKLVRRYTIPLLREAPRASLYYLHHFYQFPAVFVLSRLFRVPYVYDAHDFFPRIEEHERRTPLSRSLEVLERVCVRQAETVITVGEGVADLQREAFGRGGSVVRNVVDPRLEIAPKPEVRAALGLGQDAFLIVVVGQAKPGQAIPQLLECMRFLPEHVHAALIGANVQRYSALTDRAGLASRVHLLPPVRPNEVVGFIKDANVSYLPYYPRSANYLNALPNGLFQSVSAGLPVLYPGTLPAVRAIAERFMIGLEVDPLSAVSLHEAITRLMSEPETVTELGANACRAAQILTWEREEGVLRDIVQRALVAGQDRSAANSHVRADDARRSLTRRGEH